MCRCVMTIWAITVAGLRAQCPQEPGLKFEVLSVKPSGPRSIRGSGGGPGTADPVRYYYDRASLENLVTEAYGVELAQISTRVPLDRDRFDVLATVTPQASRQDLRRMLQSLLADRFGLRMHCEWKEVAAYRLVVALGGARLERQTGPADKRSPSNLDQEDQGFPDLPAERPSAIASRQTANGPFTLVKLRAKEEPISALILMLRLPGEMPIIDSTGLPGKYTFRLVYTIEHPDVAAGQPVTREAPDLGTALEEQLGLHLTRAKISLPIIVIDSINQKPTDN